MSVGLAQRVSDRRHSRAALVLLAPAAAFLVLFVFYPLVTAGVLSFHTWDGVSLRTWNGLGNYERLIGDEVFWRAIGNNVLVAGVAVVFQVAAAMLIAYWLVRVIPQLKRIAMFGYVVPVVISEICIGLLWGFIYNPYFGMLNSALEAVGLDGLTHGWLGDSATAMPAVLNVMNLTYLGLYVLLFVAAFQNVDRTVYDAASIDGAGHWRTFFSVSVPMIWGDVQATTLLALISSFKTFSLVFVLTRGGPDHASEVVSTYMYSTGFENFEAGYASTVGIAQMVLAAAFGIVVLALLRRRKGVLES